MINLFGQKLSSLPLGELTWKRDLLYFEGPLLSEFSSDKGETYLKYWCDCNSTFNRWMIFKIKEQDRLRLVLGEKSLLEVIQQQPDHFVFIADEGTEESQYRLVESSSIPLGYLPEEDSYLDVEDYHEDENITSMVFEEQWDFEELKHVYRKFTQIYDFIFVTNKVTAKLGVSMPWQGGFSSVHFYNKIKELIPGPSQGRLGSIHYASPGYLKVHTDAEIANLALIAVNDYWTNKEVIEATYLELQNRIRELELNQILPSEAVDAFASDNYCVKLHKSLVNNLKGVKEIWLDEFVETDFAKCKIVMGHIRRLRYFQNYLSNGDVRVVTSLIKSS